jgi:hypothetical protein
MLYEGREGEVIAMNRWGLFRMRNAMLVANLISNAVGVCVVLFLSQTTRLPSEEVSELTLRINRVFLSCSFLLPLVLTVLYEKPIRSYIRKASLQSPVSEKERGEARKRLVNEHFSLRELPATPVKGKSGLIGLYTVK